MRAYRIAYAGRNFHGFQRQPDVPTVEDTLFDALRELNVLEEDGDVPAGYAAAGRTDAGTSATAQTIGFEAPDWLDAPAFNSELPPTVRAWATATVPSDFHATHDARKREYTYFQLSPPDRGWTEARANRALDRLAGEHDFHNLTPDETGTVRVLETDLRRDGDFLIVRVRSDGFPRQLVRRLVTVVGTLARGDADFEWLDRVLAHEPLKGPDGVHPAPAIPLVLTDVDYPNVVFETDETAAESTRTIFGNRRREHETLARVCAELAER